MKTSNFNIISLLEIKCINDFLDYTTIHSLNINSPLYVDYVIFENKKAYLYTQTHLLTKIINL